MDIVELIGQMTPIQWGRTAGLLVLIVITFIYLGIKLRRKTKITQPVLEPADSRKSDHINQPAEPWKIATLTVVITLFLVAIGSHFLF